MPHREYFANHKNDLLGLLRRVVELESPTSDKSAVDACSAFVVEQFRRLGASIRRHPQSDTGDHFTVDLNRTSGSDLRSPLLILLHTDTVWPKGRLHDMPFVVKEDKVFGPGTLDMKAGVVMAVFAARALHSLDLKSGRPIRILIDACEETGSPAAEALIRRLSGEASAVLCLEPALPGGLIKLRRKGRMVIRLNCRGRSAHAGNPRLGVSAIEELARQIRRFGRIRTGGISVNVGRIQGGDAVNVVAAEAQALLDVRFWSAGQRDRVIGYFESLLPELEGAGIGFDIESRIPPMERTPASRALYRRVCRIADGMGHTLRGGRTGGGSDASIASDTGVAVLDGLGPDGDGIHAVNEHVLIPSLIDRTALLTELLLRL